MKILQINTTVNSGSTGRIAEEIGNLVIRQGWQSYIAFGRNEQHSTSVKIKIGNQAEQFLHLIETRLFDRHGLGSRGVTERLVEQIALIDPDIVHLHNLHGYYINYEVLFRYLNSCKKKVVWTLHDCWAFTGHCAHFERIGCYKWKTQCNNCPGLNNYPSSLLADRSFKNFNLKKELFTKIKDRGIIVVPSKWLENYVNQSFLEKIETKVINNGIDIHNFSIKNSNIKSKHNLINKKIVVAVANIFTKEKGIEDILTLQDILSDDYKIVLIGHVDTKYKDQLSNKILYISRTENKEELAEWYSAASVFINPTYSDNFPTTNIEALACGTPVITYNTGGSPESIDTFTGSVVPKGDINKLHQAIIQWADFDIKRVSHLCRQRAVENYNNDVQNVKYIELYENFK
ncbi:MAG: glycosyltransferase [Saprospiraceae bacterium]|nr:glycosyltransferase [Saprospiraceae bacterium]